jgi:hypothetical protein
MKDNNKIRGRITKVYYFFSSFKYASVNDMICRNAGQAFVAIFKRLLTTMGGACSAGFVYDIKIVLTKFSEIAASQGIKGLVLYLKTCSVCLQQHICGHVGGSPNVPRVSKTPSGIPRVLPPRLRSLMAKGHVVSIRLALTMFSLYRDMEFPGTMKLHTITDPSTAAKGTIKMMTGLIPRFINVFVKPTAPKEGMREWLKGRFSYFPISTSSPSSQGVYPSTHPANLHRAAMSLTDKQVSDLAILVRMTYKDELSKTRNPMYGEQTGMNPIDAIRLAKEDPLNAAWVEYVAKATPTGKLGLKLEAAGKVRVFAMIDPWSQWALYPFHKGIFRVLSRYPEIDGTFDQLKPLKRAYSHSHNKNYGLYSMDLSAATDRLPISIQTPLISAVFGFDAREGRAWHDTLVNRAYDVPQKASKYMKGGVPASVLYATGQPMGGYSSWPMLALTHHFIVQVAAWTTGITSKDSIFKGYAVLGDDIVIYDRIVAKAYHSIITSLGVECNLSKSITSPKGLGLEFAKRTFWGNNDISPTPLKEFYSAMGSIQALIEYKRKYNLSTAQALKVAGFGHKVISALNKPFHKISNIKVKYIVFNDFITNPNTMTVALRAQALGISNFRFSLLLASFASDYGVSMIERYKSAISNINTVGLFKYPSGSVLSRLHDLWAIPYLNKLNKLYKTTISEIGDRMVPFDNDFLSYMYDTKWDNVKVKYSRADPSEGIRISVDFIKDLIIFDKHGSIYDPETIAPKYLELNKVPKRPGFPGLHRIQMAWTSFFNKMRKDRVQASLTPVFVKSDKVDTGRVSVKESSMIPVPTSILRTLKRVVAPIIFKPATRPPIRARMFPWVISKWQNAASIGYRTVFWFILGEIFTIYFFGLITYSLFEMVTFLVVHLLREDLSWALFWPIWLNFSKNAILHLETWKGFFHSLINSFSSTPVSFGPMSGITYKSLTLGMALSSWIISQLDAIESIIDAVTLAYNDGAIAILGAISGRIYFHWLKPCALIVLFPLKYVWGVGSYLTWVPCPGPGVWSWLVSNFDLIVHGIPLDPWVITDVYTNDGETSSPPGLTIPEGEFDDQTSVWSDDSDKTAKYSDYFRSPDGSPIHESGPSTQPEEVDRRVKVRMAEETLDKKERVIAFISENPSMTYFIVSTAIAFSLKFTVTVASTYLI